MTSAYFGSPRGLVSYYNTYPCYLGTVVVWGSSPHGPTIVFNNFRAPDMVGRKRVRFFLQESTGFSIPTDWKSGQV